MNLKAKNQKNIRYFHKYNLRVEAGCLHLLSSLRAVFVLSMMITCKSADAADKPIRVICVGASDVSSPTGYGTPNFPVYLAQMLGYGYEVLNFGASGTTMMKTGNAPYWMTSQYKESLSSSPDIVVIMLGSNDSKPYNWSHSADYKPAYVELIKEYQNLPSRPKVYLNTLLTVYGNGNFDITDSVVSGQIVPLIKQIGMETGLPVFDVNAGTKNMPQNFPDNVHPNSAGAKVVALVTYRGIMSTGGGWFNPEKNLALHQRVSCSSEADSSPATNAVDEDWGTRWSSEYRDDAWLEVDLGKKMFFTDIYLNWESAFGVAYKILISDDGKMWRELFSTNVGDGGIDHISAKAFARYVKLQGVKRATHYGYSLYDLAVINRPGSQGR